MAFSAFKSTSKRGTNNSSTGKSSERKSIENSLRKSQNQRSKSVSAFSRNPSNASSDFSNKRENPLFWSSGSPPPDDEPVPENRKFDEPTRKFGAANSKIADSDVSDNRRGRSVLRNEDKSSGIRKEIGRSLSRVDTGRRGRSVSLNPGSRANSMNSESEVESESNSWTNYRNRNGSNLDVNKVNKSSSDTSDYDMLGMRTWSSQHPPSEPLHGLTTSLSCSEFLNWDDEISTTTSLSGAEEKITKAVCRQMKSYEEDRMGGDTTTTSIYETVRSEVRRAISDIKNDLEIAIHRSTATSIGTSNVADIPPELVNPGAVELVMDIRHEYAKKLELSQERARILRADLAVEEHREQELSRILKERIPDQKTPNVQKSRPGRKSSIERRRMSKRLTEEAMTYFDECVSLSTFDSSDFSSPEDPQLNIVGVTTSVGDRVFPRASTSISATYPPNSCRNDEQGSSNKGPFEHSNDVSELTASSSSSKLTLNQNLSGTNKEHDRKFKFSFSREPTETFEFQQDIRKYIRNFEKDVKKDDIHSHVTRLNYCDVDEYNFRASTQSFLFDKVLLSNRVEDGSLLLCGGGIAISCFPFASGI